MLEITIKIESDDNHITSNALVSVNGEAIGFISRLRVDASKDDVPGVEIDMLKGVSLDSLDAEALAKAGRHFDMLRLIPGAVARMPAPRDA